jgi:hypothetical protein
MNFDLKALDIMPGMSYEQKQEGLEFILPGIHNVSNSYCSLSCFLLFRIRDVRILQGDLLLLKELKEGLMCI